jgi:hypothetical protein
VTALMDRADGTGAKDRVDIVREALRQGISA